MRVYLSFILSRQLTQLSVYHPRCCNCAVFCLRVSNFLCSRFTISFSQNKNGNAAPAFYSISQHCSQFSVLSCLILQICSNALCSNRIHNLVSCSNRSCQRSIETSSSNLRAQKNQFEQQQNELFTKKSAIESYEPRLKDAQLEVENEREKLKLAEQQKKRLGYDLFCERKTVDELKAEVQSDKTHLQ